jgi:hypothetical protein
MEHKVLWRTNHMHGQAFLEKKMKLHCKAGENQLLCEVELWKFEMDLAMFTELSVDQLHNSVLYKSFLSLVMFGIQTCEHIAVEDIVWEWIAENWTQGMRFIL